MIYYERNNFCWHEIKLIVFGFREIRIKFSDKYVVYKLNISFYFHHKNIGILYFNIVNLFVTKF